MHATPELGDDLRKYAQLADVLRRQLKDGTLPPGQSPSPITRLAAERGWSRGTRTHTMQTLNDGGLVGRTPGYGYYVVFREPSESDGS